MSAHQFAMIGLLATTLLASGCATLSQPRAFSSLGQFEQFQLNENVFRVSYTGNGYTLAPEAEEIALLQAARVTLEKGFRYFSVISDPSNGNNIANRGVVVAYDPFGAGSLYSQRGVVYRAGSAYDRFYGNFYNDWYFPDRVQIGYTIACTKQAKTEQTQFDAQLILQSLGQKYRLNPDGSEQKTQAQMAKK